MIALAVTLCAACGSARPGGPARSAGPSDATRAAIADAEAHERARHHDRARAAYRRAVDEAPDAVSEAYARRELASALAFWGEVPAAITELEVAVRLAPGAAPAWHDLGILRHTAGDDAGAAVALRTARALRPADPRPRIALAALLWQAGDRAGAAAEYRALLELELPARVRDRVEWALAQLAR